MQARIHLTTKKHIPGILHCIFPAVIPQCKPDPGRSCRRAIIACSKWQWYQPPPWPGCFM